MFPSFYLFHMSIYMATIPVTEPYKINIKTILINNFVFLIFLK